MAKVTKSNRDKGLQRRLVVLMTDEQHAWIQAHSEATSVPVTAILRRAVEMYRQSIEGIGRADRARKS